jgi:uncharacterized protein (TIGR02118 family)
MVKMTLLYGHPKDAAAFERYYADTSLPLAAKIKGIRIELAKVIGTPDGSRPAFYRQADVYYESRDHMDKVMATPEAQAAVADIANFATGGVTIIVSDVQ